FVWGHALLPFLGQRGDAHFPARPLDARALDARTLDARTRGLRGGSLGMIRLRLVGMLLLLALGAAAQASRGVQVSGGSGGGTHGSIPFTWASKPIVSRAASSTRSPRGRRARCALGRASDAARRRAGRRASARRSPADATTTRGRPAPRSPPRGASPGAAP